MLTLAEYYLIAYSKDTGTRKRYGSVWAKIITLKTLFYIIIVEKNSIFFIFKSNVAGFEIAIF